MSIANVINISHRRRPAPFVQGPDVIVYDTRSDFLPREAKLHGIWDSKGMNPFGGILKGSALERIPKAEPLA
jgi:hypothetical protein